MESERICVEGKNCWRITRARRAAFLIDGEAYFPAFAAAAEQARESLLIVGWDIDSRLSLVRDPSRKSAVPPLGSFLHSLVERRRSLHVYVLLWDFAMIYALDRELLPLYSHPWRTHRRIHFRLDGDHPVGASHHQKIVVADDAVAFVGGLDLSKRRWDTREHRAQDPRRVDPDYQPYPPYHDVQIAVDGETAAALGDLVRERWRRTTGRRVAPPRRADRDPWPSGLEPDLENIPVAIARTEPAHDGRPAVREIEALCLDGISAARRLIYIENQYLTSTTVGDALASRLQENDGPEIVLVLPKENSGWLEQGTMGVLRARLLRRLREADRFGRLRVYCPVVEGLRDGCVSVHAKVLIVDDRLVRIGSSNLNNRSMGLDTECDLVLEALGDSTLEKAIERLRNGLIGEHLGLPPGQFTEKRADKNSVGEAIDALRDGPRRLEPLDGKVPEWMDAMLPQTAVVDPERPLDAEALVEKFAGEEGGEAPKHLLLRAAAFVLVLMGVGAAWYWTPLTEMLGPERLGDSLSRFQAMSLGPLLVLGAYVLGSLVLMPITFLIVATALLFEPVLAFAYALMGSLLGATATYGVGYLVGRKGIRHIAATRLKRVHARLSRYGLLSVIVLRIVPVAPFSVINMIAGAFHLSFRDFALGTLLGMSPGILAITLLERQVKSAVSDPNVENVALLAGLAVVFVAAVTVLNRWMSAGGTRRGEKTPG